MDEVDNVMQAESLQVGNVIQESTEMELEQEEQHTVRDAEMEIHDIEAEFTIEDMKAAIVADDSEMAAEMLEQEHTHTEGEWKDIHEDVSVDQSHRAVSGTASSLELNKVDAEPALAGSADKNGDNELPHEEAVDEGLYLNGQSVTEPVPGDQGEAGQLTLEETLERKKDAPEAHPEHTGSSEKVTDVPPHTDPLADVQESESVLEQVGTEHSQKGRPDLEENYADANEVQQEQPAASGAEDLDSTSAQAYQAYDDQPVASSSTGYRRPVLQKDYLSHVEVFSGAPPSLHHGDDVAAPHVSLIFNNETYSLFRPSSVPSGDDEHVMFGEDQDQKLYYSSLDNLIGRLHEAFPHFRGDGDNELILDFGILDMQISEDNVYTQQLSLHDFDKIRVGMCQPELDRLQISLLTGKRFVYKFNELTEHVYRMYAGSEYDSGTIYDETADGAEELEIPEYYPDEEESELNEAAAPAEETTAKEAEVEEEEVDYDAGEVIQEGTVDYDGENDLVEQNIRQEDEAEEEDTGEEVHPPSDEYYEDPEFSQQPGVEAGGYEDEDVEDDNDAYGDNAEGDEYANDDRSETLQDNTEVFEHTASDTPAEVEAELAIDPDAPLDEVVAQIEEFEEAGVKREEDAAAEAVEAKHDAVVPTTTGVNVEAVDRDTERIYQGMDSLAAEDKISINAHAEPSSSIAPELPVATMNGNSKRSREDEDEEAEAPEGIGASVAAAAIDFTKRPRVSLEADGA